jgi:hypothetical protein
MRKIIGIIGLGAGIYLLFLGYKTAAAATGNQVQPLVDGAPTNRATYYYIGGAALVLYGIVQMLWKKK